MKFLAWLMLVVGLLLLPATAAAASYPEACSLITKSDAEAALGEPAAEPQNKLISLGSTTAPTISMCHFGPAGAAIGKSVVLTARYLPVADQFAADSVRETLKKTMGEPKDIAGVGDKALWVFQKKGGTPLGQLHVFSKGTIYLVVTISGNPDESAALDKAKRLALKALARI
jgi:hypothetical protein